MKPNRLPQGLNIYFRLPLGLCLSIYYHLPHAIEVPDMYGKHFFDINLFVTRGLTPVNPTHAVVVAIVLGLTG